MAAHDEESSLVLVVGYEGSDPARRALAAAGRILRDREGWIEVVYVGPTEGGAEDSAGHTWTCRDTTCQPCSFRSTPRSPGPRSGLTQGSADNRVASAPFPIWMLVA